MGQGMHELTVFHQTGSVRDKNHTCRCHITQAYKLMLTKTHFNANYREQQTWIYMKPFVANILVILMKKMLHKVADAFEQIFSRFYIQCAFSEIFESACFHCCRVSRLVAKLKYFCVCRHSVWNESKTAVFLANDSEMMMRSWGFWG